MEIQHEVLTPLGIKVFVGGCYKRGEGSRFRAKAHSHWDNNELWVCYLSNKWLHSKELALHEAAHCLTKQGHTDKWRTMVYKLGGTCFEVPGILRDYTKKPRLHKYKLLPTLPR